MAMQFDPETGNLIPSNSSTQNRSSSLPSKGKKKIMIGALGLIGLFIFPEFIGLTFMFLLLYAGISVFKN